MEEKTTQEAAAIKAALGEAISAWALVEDELSLVFEAVINAEHLLRVKAVFYSVRSFEARLSMVNAAFTAWPRFPEKIHKEWNALYNRLNSKNKKRNELAHCGAVMLHENGANPTPFLDPYSRTSSLKVIPKKDNLLSFKQVSERAISFYHLAGHVSWFEEQLSKHLGRQSRSLLLANNQALRLHIEGAQTPEEPDKQP